MFTRHVCLIRPQQWSSLRSAHISRPVNMEKNRSFYLSKANKTDKFDSGALFLLIIPVSTFALGVWQIERRKWKINLIETLKARTNAEPIPLLDNLDRLLELEYQPVRVRGRFDHSREILVQPRSRLDEAASETRVGSRQTNSAHTGGAHVITPFMVSGRNFDILVNRGYVPFELRDPSTRFSGQIKEEHEIVGLVRTTDQLNAMWNRNDPMRDIWRTRDVTEMASYLNTAPIFIDAVKSTTVPGGPIGGQTNVQLRNEHLSYIFTWFALSALTAFMWIRKYVL